MRGLREVGVRVKGVDLRWLSKWQSLYLYLSLYITLPLYLSLYFTLEGVCGEMGECRSKMAV